jgi:hypothetical protein
MRYGSWSRSDLRSRRATKANRKDLEDLEENISALRSLWFKSSLTLGVETDYFDDASRCIGKAMRKGS